MMEGGTAFFRDNVPFTMQIYGTVDSQSFTIDGKGEGNAMIGYLKGKWVCTSGQLPLPWTVMACIFGKGLKCFAKYPNGISHFFQECMPEGYSQERVTRFHDDGIFKTYYEIHYNKGLVMSKVTMQADGFKKDSPILANGLKCMEPAIETSYAYEGGLRSLAHHVYPMKRTSGGYAIVTQTTVNRPLGNNSDQIRLPAHHYVRNEVKQYKDVDDDTEHIIQEEQMEGFEFKLLTE